MASAVETDLSQPRPLVLASPARSARRSTRARSRSEIRARVREELDYQREAKIARLYRLDAGRPAVRARAAGRGEIVDPASLDAAMARRRAAGRLREGAAGGARRDRRRPVRRVVAAVPALRDHSRRSASRQLHGRLRRAEGGKRAPSKAINLFDYGCVRIFPPRFVRGVVELYLALKANDGGRHRRSLCDVGIYQPHARGDSKP